MGAVCWFTIVFAYFVAWLERAFAGAVRFATLFLTKLFEAGRLTAFGLGVAWLLTLEAIALGAKAARAKNPVSASRPSLLFICFLPFEVV